MPPVADSRAAAAASPCGASVPDADLLQAASAIEADAAFWVAEFAWLLRHPALAGVGAAGSPLGPHTGAGEHAVRFPAACADAAWLGERSVHALARRIAPLLAGGGEVSVDLSVLAGGERSDTVRREQMRLVTGGLAGLLPAALARFGVAARGVVFSAGADHPGLGELLRLRACAGLGHPPVLLRLPDRLILALRGAESDGCADWPGDPLRMWQGLTSLAHREAGIHLVLQQTTRPACALAASERADAVLPASLFEVRAQTAWPALRLSLEALGADSPAAATRELRRLLAAGLRLADNLVEQVDWPAPELAQDAWVNRRLAVHLTGIGDLVDAWRLDPADFACARLVARWMRLARRLMRRESNALARERGPFPGLDLREIESTLSRSFGGEHARRLLRQAGLRHRHLLVLSPFSLFPQGRPRRPLPSYLHLLPALRWADTIALCGDGMARALPLATYRRLLRMTWAIARNRS